MKTVVLDVTGCRSLSDLHARIRTAFDFPAWYGNNWDAFWDLLNRECDVETITVVGGQTVSEQLKPSVKQLTELLEENKRYWQNRNTPFAYEVIS